MPGYDEASAEAIASLDNEQQVNDDAAASPEGAPEASEPSSETPAVVPPTEQPQPGDSDFDPAKWSLKFRDQVVQPKDRNHLIQLAQQGFSYSQRMQDLKRQEGELKAQGQQYQQYQKLADAFQKNPTFREKLLAMYQESLAGGQQQAPAPQGENQQPAHAQLPPELLEEINELKSWKEKYTEQQVDQQVSTEIQSLRSKYTRDDWDVPNTSGMSLIKEIIAHNYGHPSMTLEQAYRDLMFDKVGTNAKAEGLKQAAAVQKKQAKQGVVAGRAPAAPSGKPAGINTSASYDELAQQAIAEFVKS